MGRLLVTFVAAVTTGLGVVGGLTLTDDPAIAGFLGLCWGLAVALTLRVRSVAPGLATATGWADSRWTVLWALVVGGTAFAGLGPTLPIDVGQRVALSLLVVGVGLASYAAALLTAAERR